jgi:hypothetical protein
MEEVGAWLKWQSLARQGPKFKPQYQTQKNGNKDQSAQGHTWKSIH